MECYWFDHDAGEALEPTLPVLRVLVTATLARPMNKISVPQASVVFVHPGNLKPDWRTAAKAHNSGFVVYVSNYPGTLPNLVANEHCLERNMEEFTNSGDAAAFARSCIDGRPNWSLLKPPRLRENMVALLLIELARQRAKDPEIGAAVHLRLLDEAQREYGGNLPEAEAERISALRQALAT